MKFGPIVLALVMVSCVAPHSEQQPVGNTPNYSPQPGVDMEKEQALRKKEAAISEQKAYDESLEKITQIIQTEALNLQICSEAASKSECDDMLTKYCQVDTLVDTRGRHWHKPYCK